MIIFLISYIYQHIMYAKKTLAISSEVAIDIYNDGALRMVVSILYTDYYQYND